MATVIPLSDGLASEVIQRFGHSVSPVLDDPSCQRFVVPALRGLIAYRESWHCAVALGDPMCADGSELPMVERFRRFNADRGRATMVAVAGPELAAACANDGWGAIECGEELIYDPRIDPTGGRAGRELRKKVRRAEVAGVTVDEYRGPPVSDEHEAAALAWLKGRRGLQVYVAPLTLLGTDRRRRRLVAHHGGSVAGLLQLCRLEAHRGWTIEHLFAVPGAPAGTSELLVTRAFALVASEGCAFVSFGPSPPEHLGQMSGLSATWRAVGRAALAVAQRAFVFEGLSHYRHKFGPRVVEPRFLLVHPARLGLTQLLGLLSAFHVSLWW
jgi:lysylphosphatidylglycerol synthetase-like protein (DUF2156 family)